MPLGILSPFLLLFPGTFLIFHLEVCGLGPYSFYCFSFSLLCSFSSAELWWRLLQVRKGRRHRAQATDYLLWGLKIILQVMDFLLVLMRFDHLLSKDHGGEELPQPSWVAQPLMMEALKCRPHALISSSVVENNIILISNALWLLFKASRSSHLINLCCGIILGSME